MDNAILSDVFLKMNKAVQAIIKKNNITGDVKAVLIQEIANKVAKKINNANITDDTIKNNVIIASAASLIKKELNVSELQTIDPSVLEEKLQTTNDINMEEENLDVPLEVVNVENTQEEKKVNPNNSFNPINLVNAKSETIKIIKDKLQDVDLLDAELDDIITYIRSKHSDEDIKNGRADNLINTIKESVKLKKNSVGNKTNEVVKHEKKKTTKNDIVKKVLKFISIGTALVILISYVNSIHKDKQLTNEVNEYIASYLNEEEFHEVKSGTRYIPPTSIVSRNEEISPSGEYVIYDYDGIANDIKTLQSVSDNILDTAIMNTFRNMNVSLETALDAMNKVFQNLNMPMNFVEYISTYVNLTDDEKIMLDAYKQKGYASLTEEQREILKALINKYINLEVKIYSEDYETIKNMKGINNGTSRS